MSLVGMASGAAKSLEEIVAERLQRQILEQEVAERQKRFAMDERRFNETAEQNKYDRERTDRIDGEQSAARAKVEARDATERNGRSDMAAVLAMPGMTDEAKRNEIMGSGLRTGTVSPANVMDAIKPTPAKLRAVTARGPQGQPINRMVPETEAVEEYRAPVQGPSARRSSQWVRMADGSVVDINGIAPPGSKPYDAVSERSSQPANPAEAQDTAREAGRLASELLKHPGLGGAFGVYDAMMPTVRQGTADAESIRDSLTSLLTLENTGKLKGVLSNTDMQILRQASSSLNAKMGDAAARAELARIVQVMQRASGDSQMPSMDMATSRGNTAPSSDPVDALIAKYGRKPQ